MKKTASWVDGLSSSYGVINENNCELGGGSVNVML